MQHSAASSKIEEIEQSQNHGQKALTSKLDSHVQNLMPPGFSRRPAEQPLLVLFASSLGRSLLGGQAGTSLGKRNRKSSS